MTHSIYTTQQLEKLKLSEIKAIALQLGLTPVGDRRRKNVWADAIIAHQSSQVEKLSVNGTQMREIRPLVEMNGDDCIVDGAMPTAGGAIAATITSDDDLTQPWVVKIGGVEVHRANTWARCYDYVRTHVKYGTLPIQEQPSIEPQPIALPKVGESHFIGDRLLRCIEVGNDYAAVWDVISASLPMGEIYMGWDCFWMHNLSLELFATPQEAVVDLCESAAALIEKTKPELEVFTTNDPNVFAVHSLSSGKRYEVCPDSNFCSCPHWLYRHEQEGISGQTY
ncbi:hypothetical protein [Nostoc sp.]